SSQNAARAAACWLFAPPERSVNARTAPITTTGISTMATLPTRCKFNHHRTTEGAALLIRAAIRSRLREVCPVRASGVVREDQRLEVRGLREVERPRQRICLRVPRREWLHPERVLDECEDGPELVRRAVDGAAVRVGASGGPRRDDEGRRSW